MGTNHTYRYVKTSGLGTIPRYWCQSTVQGSVQRTDITGQQTKTRRFEIYRISSTYYFAMCVDPLFNQYVSASGNPVNSVRCTCTFAENTFNDTTTTVTNCQAPTLAESIITGKIPEGTTYSVVPITNNISTWNNQGDGMTRVMSDILNRSSCFSINSYAPYYYMTEQQSSKCDIGKYWTQSRCAFGPFMVNNTYPGYRPYTSSPSDYDLAWAIILAKVPR